MQTKSIVFVAAAFLAVLASGTAFQSATRAQEYRGTMEQQMACTPDVWRLCSDQIPDVNRIVACLRQNAPNLSDECRAVFLSNNADPRRPPPRGRPPGYGTPMPPPGYRQPMPPPSDDD
jgi:hypothetical protein